MKYLRALTVSASVNWIEKVLMFSRKLLEDLNTKLKVNCDGWVYGFHDQIFGIDIDRKAKPKVWIPHNMMRICPSEEKSLLFSFVYFQ